MVISYQGPHIVKEKVKPPQSMIVADYMSTRLITFRPDQSIYEAVDMLLKHRISGGPVVNENNELIGAIEGNLCMNRSWPGQMRTVYGDHQRFIDTYFSTFEGRYFSGDGARRDEDGYYWITGRVDDVLNVSGHRMGTAEIESALVAHPKVAESAIVGYPHDIKGQGIYAYVTLNADEAPSDELRAELRNWVRQEIGPIASPDLLQWAPGLPKTRSGKIMRRILRKIAADDFSELGDTSTLADPSVVEDLIKHRQNKG